MIGLKKENEALKAMKYLPLVENLCIWKMGGPTIKAALAVLASAFVLLPGKAHAQDISFPSPTAASLSKYQDIPVDLSTGLPSISIPIYHVQGNGVSVPISLNYNASDIQVATVPSWVGFGWSLRAGGAVTRVMKGNPDETGIGYMETGNDTKFKDFVTRSIKGTLTDADNSIGALQNLVRKNVDSEQDVFYFSFPGFSGKFVIGPREKNGAYQVYTRPLSNLDIDLEIQAGKIKQIKIIDPNGIQYFFGNGLNEDSYANSIEEVITPSHIRYHDYATAWYLRQIVNPSTNASVVFHYDRFVEQTRHAGKYEGRFQALPVVPGASVPNSYRTDAYIHQITPFLTGISSSPSNEHLEFISSARPSTSENARLKKLDKIIIKKREEYHSERTFLYEVFGRRMYLTEVYQSVGQDRLPGHGFYYNNPQDVPSRLSLAVDHWGYYNGRVSNTSLIPLLRFYDPDWAVRVYSPTQAFGTYNLKTDLYRFYEGSDRSTNQSKVAYGALNKIIYPTGGATMFTYEANDYSYVFYGNRVPKHPRGPVAFDDIAFLTDFKKSNGSINNALYQGSYPSSLCRAFIDGASDREDVTHEFTVQDDRMGEGWIKFGITFDLQNSTRGTKVLLNGGVLSSPDTPTGGPLTYSTEISKRISNGTHTLTLSSDGHSKNMICVRYTIYEEKRADIKKGGGIRLKKVESMNDTGNSEHVKHYKYHEKIGGIAYSTGKVFSEPKYDFLFPGNNGYIDRSSTSTHFIGMLSSPVQIFGGESRRHVGYETVKVLHGEEGEHGYEIHHFNLEKDEGAFKYTSSRHSWADQPAFITKPSFTYRWGKRKKSGYYNAAGELIKKETFTYQDHEGGPENAHTFRTFPQMALIMFNGDIGKFMPYLNFVAWMHPSSEAVEMMDGPTVNKEYEYSESEHKTPTKVTHTDSDGSVREARYTYAHEQYGGMRGANMLSQPYSVEVRDGSGKALSKNWTLWKNRGSTSSPRWLPCGQWAWDGGLQNGRPKAPAQTECNQLDSGGPR